MKTHELSKSLLLLSKILKSMPDMYLEELDLSKAMKLTNNKSLTSNGEVNQNEIPSALYNLVILNNVSKQQWLSFIDDFNIDIPVRTRDANRDIVGKILNYFATNPTERERLLSKNNKKSVSGSTELANALNLLLK